MMDMAPSLVDGYSDKARRDDTRHHAANFRHAILDNILLIQTTLNLFPGGSHELPPLDATEHI